MKDEQHGNRTRAGNGATDLTVNRRSILLGGTALAAAAATLAPAPSTGPALAQPAGSKPNILFIMGDDIGWFNVSAYNIGIMGYRTPNIDRIGKEGAVFTDWYGQQSCTAGRAAFITGQSPIRTGLTKVGLPGAELGLGPEDPSVADVMKKLGYATGQFGKNHLGDRNEYLPTVHGFDEFFGNLYHLNAEEEPENPDYPKDPSFRAKFGPRGVLKCKASDTDDPTVDPAFGKVGKQMIENTGPLDTKRMETIDEEFLAAAMDFIKRKNGAGTPWFCYFNSTRMHVFTHLKKELRARPGSASIPTAWWRRRARRPAAEAARRSRRRRQHHRRLHDRQRRRSHHLARRRHHAVQGREGDQLGRRVPRAVPDPLARRDQARHDRQRHMRARGFHPHLRGRGGRAGPGREGAEGPRAQRQDIQGPSRRRQPHAVLQGRGGGIAAQGFLYWSDDGDLMAIRVGMEGRLHGAEHRDNPQNAGRRVARSVHQAARAQCFTICAPIRSSEGTEEHILRRLDGAPKCSCSCRRRPSSAKWLESFKEFPPRAKAASFTISDVMDKITAASPNQN